MIGLERWNIKEQNIHTSQTSLNTRSLSRIHSVTYRINHIILTNQPATPTLTNNLPWVSSLASYVFGSPLRYQAQHNSPLHYTRVTSRMCGHMTLFIDSSDAQYQPRHTLHLDLLFECAFISISLMPWMQARTKGLHWQVRSHVHLSFQPVTLGLSLSTASHEANAPASNDELYDVGLIPRKALTNPYSPIFLPSMMGTHASMARSSLGFIDFGSSTKSHGHLSHSFHNHRGPPAAPPQTWRC